MALALVGYASVHVVRLLVVATGTADLQLDFGLLLFAASLAAFIAVTGVIVVGGGPKNYTSRVSGKAA
jgi:hypothetical protein